MLFKGLKLNMIVKVRQSRQRSFYGRVTSILSAAILVVSCQERIDVRGNLPNPDLLQDIEVGHITKNEVADLLGTPSSVAPFSSDTWYYISERTKTVAFFEPGNSGAKRSSSSNLTGKA
jgi:Small protein A (tmRNA-binding)